MAVISFLRSRRVIGSARRRGQGASAAPSGAEPRRKRPSAREAPLACSSGSAPQSLEGVYHGRYVPPRNLAKRTSNARIIVCTASYNCAIVNPARTSRGSADHARVLTSRVFGGKRRRLAAFSCLFTAASRPTPTANRRYRCVPCAIPLFRRNFLAPRGEANCGLLSHLASPYVVIVVFGHAWNVRRAARRKHEQE